MCMYIEAYHLTVNRVVSLWALGTIGILLLGVMISIYKKNFPLFRYGVMVVSVCYLILSFSHMDYFIADYDLKKISENEPYFLNTDTYASEGEEGYYNTTSLDYVIWLSSDAAPAIARYDGAWKKDYEDRMKDMYGEESIRKFNLSHHIALKNIK